MSDETPSPTRPTSAFEPLPDELDFPSMERRMLDLWAAEDTFERLRAKNADGPRWSFFDGPITANNPMGVHHAWGRTYKDVYQRYRAMRGYHQRYQNGFDCQGLWLEVEVEKDLGFNSKRDIEAFGLEAFADACRERVEKFSGVQTRQSIRLGQWMDWDDSYYTHSDTNIEHIWHFLQRCNERGWIAPAQRAMPWCARCGTALSQHELIDTYEEVEHDAVYVRLPVHGRPDTWLLIWTTTPWTLAANVAAAVHPDLTYVEVLVDGARYVLAEAAVPAVIGEDAEIVASRQGADLLDWTYDGPFDDLPAVRGVTHRVIPWTDVGADEGTGIVHIAPGAGEEDFRLGQDLGLEVLVPIDENGDYVAGYDWLTGRDAREVADDVIADLRTRGLLHRAHTYTHRYPHCWRCREELVFRVDDEWFIRADEIRQPMLDAAATVRWTPAYAGARMADWLRNMGDWNISRRRYWGLPLPFYPCQACGHLTVIGSKAHLAERAIEGMGQLRELHRPWIDRVVIRCEACEAPTQRIDAVGDAWLDAGIVPFSTLGYLENSEEFEDWYPADFITEMREQIRLWFYSMLFMSVTIENRSPYQSVFVYEKLNDESGRPMHKSWGNAIDFGEAAERMGADVMRWMYASQNPVYNINFGYGPATEVKRRMLTLWNVYSFFVTYARLDGFDPTAPRIPVAERPDLDRWALSRLQGLIDTMTGALDDYMVSRGVQAAQAFIEDLSNWYVRRGRRRYWKSDSDDDKQAAYQTLHELLTTLTRLLAPVMPFWTDDIYQNLVRRSRPGRPNQRPPHRLARSRRRPARPRPGRGHGPGPAGRARRSGRPQQRQRQAAPAAARRVGSRRRRRRLGRRHGAATPRPRRTERQRPTAHDLRARTCGLPGPPQLPRAGPALRPPGAPGGCHACRTGCGGRRARTRRTRVPGDRSGRNNRDAGAQTTWTCAEPRAKASVWPNRTASSWPSPRTSTTNWPAKASPANSSTPSRACAATPAWKSQTEFTSGSMAQRRCTRPWPNTRMKSRVKSWPWRSTTACRRRTRLNPPLP